MSLQDIQGSYLGILLRGAGVVMIGVVYARVARYGFTLIIARMGPVAWGSFAIGLAFLDVLATLSGLGLANGMVRYVAYFQGLGRKDAVRGTALAGWGLSTAAGTVAGVALFTLADVLARICFHDAALGPVLRFVAVLIPLTAGSQILLKVILGAHELVHYVAIWRIADHTIKVVVVGLLYWCGQGLQAILWAYAAATVVTLVLSVAVVHRRVIPLVGRRLKSHFAIKQLVFFSLPLFLSGFTGVAAGWVDTLTLGHFRDSSWVGIYASATMLSTLTTLGPDLIYPVFLPLLSDRYARGAVADLSAIFGAVSRWITWMVVPAAVFLITYAAPLLQLLFGRQYAGAGLVTAVLVLGRLLYALSWPRATLLVLVGQTRAVLVVTLLANGVNAVLDLVLIPVWGMFGAGLATSISLCTNAISTVWVARRITDLPGCRSGHIPAGLVRSAAASAVAAGGSSLARHILGEERVYMALSAALFVALYLLGLMVLRVLTREDIYVLDAVCRRCGVRLPTALHRWRDGDGVEGENG